MFNMYSCAYEHIVFDSLKHSDSLKCTIYTHVVHRV